MADVLSGTGLSTSSAYTVGLITALSFYQGLTPPKSKIAQEACDLELNILKEPIGKQDQYGTAIGGLKFISFLQDGKVKIEQLSLDSTIQQTLEDNLILFYTGMTHSANEILKEQNKNIINDKQKFDALLQMVDLTYSAREALIAGNLDDFGSILHSNWVLKRSLASKITNPLIDEYYDRALANGALGGKLLGAGNGGFLLFYCPKEKQEGLRKAMGLVELPFSFENEGVKIILA